MRARASTCLLAVALTTIPALLTGPASAASSFTVMNTSEPPPDGVWFRNSPATGDTSRETGFGVYAGERLRADCWSWGEAMGAFSNRIWYRGLNESRPSFNGRTNYGWLNTHYVDDGMPADQPAPGVPACVNTSEQPPPPPAVTAAYYSPFGHGSMDAPGAPGVRTRSKSEWAAGSCATQLATSGVPASVDKISGWSLGRLGPVYFLTRATATQRQQVDQVVMIDPGSYGEMSQSCEAQRLQNGRGSTVTAGQALASWLASNPQARLIILSGNLTTDTAHLRNGRGSAGIQTYYLNAIRSAGVGPVSRTLICNYSVPGTDPNSSSSLNRSHNVMYQGAKKHLGSRLSGCPQVYGATRGASWRP